MASSLRSRKILLAIIVAVVIVASVFALLFSLPSPKGTKVTVTSFPLEFSVALNKAVYTLNDNISLSFYLRNLSNETVSIWRSSMDGGQDVTTSSEGVTIEDAPPREIDLLFHFGYTLLIRNGTVLDQHSGGPAQAVYALNLEPNASLNQTLSINLATFYDQYLMRLQKGLYQITGAIWGITNVENTTLETPPINFTIS